MGVQMRIDYARYRPGGEMDELTPNPLPGNSLAVPATLPHSHGDPGFDFLHRLGNCPAEGGDDGGIAGQAVEQGNGLRDMEVEIVANSPALPRSGGKPLAGFGMSVVAKPLEGAAVHLTIETQPTGQAAAPAADHFLLAEAVILGPAGVVALGGSGVALLDDAEHAGIIAASSAGARTKLRSSTSDYSPIAEAIGKPPQLRGEEPDRREDNQLVN